MVTLEKIRKRERDLQRRAAAMVLKQIQRVTEELQFLLGKIREEVHRIQLLAGDGKFEEQILELSYGYREGLHRKIEKKKEELLKLKKRLKEEMQKLEEQEKKVQALEKLKERELEKYREQEKRGEAYEMDEVSHRSRFYNDSTGV